MKKIIFILAITISMFSQAAMSAETIVTGIVTVLHYNGASNYALDQRGVCVQLSPAISNTWRCAYKTNHLYNEFHSALVMSKMMGRPVSIRSQDDWKIDLVELK